MVHWSFCLLSRWMHTSVECNEIYLAFPIWNFLKFLQVKVLLHTIPKQMPEGLPRTITTENYDPPCHLQTWIRPSTPRKNGKVGPLEGGLGYTTRGFLPQSTAPQNNVCSFTSITVHWSKGNKKACGGHYIMALELVLWFIFPVSKCKIGIVRLKNLQNSHIGSLTCWV